VSDSDESRQVVLEFLAAVSAGDMERIERVLSPDARCWLPGPPHWGRVLTREEYLESFGVFAEQMAGEFDAKLGPVVAEGEHVCVQMESAFRLRNGKLYNNQYHLYYRVQDGRIVVVKGYFDTLHYAECFDLVPDEGEPPRHTNLFDVE
jgi:ketosteroid isomerase-like protein